MADGKRFSRKREDFVCEHCGQEVKGRGFTDHCPKCLWSKHVDINPGDRASKCKGMMEPVGAARDGGSFIIYYICIGCKARKTCVAASDDDNERIEQLVQ